MAFVVERLVFVWWREGSELFEDEGPMKRDGGGGRCGCRGEGLLDVGERVSAGN